MIDYTCQAFQSIISKQYWEQILKVHFLSYYMLHRTELNKVKQGDTRGREKRYIGDKVGRGVEEGMYI